MLFRFIQESHTHRLQPKIILRKISHGLTISQFLEFVQMPQRWSFEFFLVEIFNLLIDEILRAVLVLHRSNFHWLLRLFLNPAIHCFLDLILVTDILVRSLPLLMHSFDRIDSMRMLSTPIQEIIKHFRKRELLLLNHHIKN